MSSTDDQDIPESRVYIQMGDDKRVKIGNIKIPEDLGKFLNSSMVEVLKFTLNEQARVCEEWAKNCREECAKLDDMDGPDLLKVFGVE